MIIKIAIIIIRHIFRKMTPKIRTIFCEQITNLENFIKQSPNKYDDLALKILKDIIR